MKEVKSMGKGTSMDFSRCPFSLACMGIYRCGERVLEREKTV